MSEVWEFLAAWWPLVLIFLLFALALSILVAAVLGPLIHPVERRDR